MPRKMFVSRNCHSLLSFHLHSKVFLFNTNYSGRNPINRYYVIQKLTSAIIILF